MSMNENVIKNIANEVTRNAQAVNVNVEQEFVIYLIDLLLLNPKYGKLFAKSLTRNKLEYFVKECVDMMSYIVISTNTLKMQHTMKTHYNTPQNLINQHLDSIETCLKPLINEIMETEPQTEEESAKLYRKISIYFIMCSGLGSPSNVVNLKEGLAAFSSIYSKEDLQVFVTLTTMDKLDHLNELLSIVSGIRLFNRDCQKGGDSIYDIPFKLSDASTSCLTSLTNSLIAVMKRVNTLTSAIMDNIAVDDYTGNVTVVVSDDRDVDLSQTIFVFDVLIFNRQYEVFIRKLMADMGIIVSNSMQYVDMFRTALNKIHDATRYKAAVPTATVFPLFIKLWTIWRSMQTQMYLVSTISKLLSALYGLQEQSKIPYKIVNSLLKDKPVLTDTERIKNASESNTSLDTLETLEALGNNYMPFDGEDIMQCAGRNRSFAFLGFCPLCLCVGALIPCNPRLGVIVHKKKKYGFCTSKMLAKFFKDPERYINEVLEYTREHPALINLLEIRGDVERVKDVEVLVERKEGKKYVYEKAAQTDLHPIESYIEKHYTWNLWDWKRRACQWATIVNCKTHSTQTIHSNLRAEIHCQTTEPRDKQLQTRKDHGINASLPAKFIFGSKAFSCEDVYYMNVADVHVDKKEPAHFFTCQWPCVTPEGPRKSFERESSMRGSVRYLFHFRSQELLPYRFSLQGPESPPTICARWHEKASLLKYDRYSYFKYFF